MHIFICNPIHHLKVDALVVEARVELLRLGLALVVELEGDVGVEPDAEVVVHHEDLRVVLALLRVRRHNTPVRLFLLAER